MPPRLQTLVNACAPFLGLALVIGLFCLKADVREVFLTGGNFKTIFTQTVIVGTAALGEVGIPLPQLPPLTWGEPRVFDVIDPAGRFLGSVTVPNSAAAGSARRVRLALASGMSIWTIEYGPFDESYVVRYRIVPGS